MSASRSSVRREGFSVLKNRRSESVDSRSRGSYVPDRRRPSSDERSGNRWSGVRKSSINPGDVKRKDVRPLSDKTYQKRKLAVLLAFFEEQGFKYPISVSKLAYPTKKDFEVMFQFLYNCFDPKYEVKKIEEEAPKILKFLGYPFNVNKSAFAYVARTSWPSLLGILIWLMDLNKFAMNVNINSVFESGSVEGDRTLVHRIVLRYICESHHAGTDNPEEEDKIFTEIVKSSICFEVGDIDELLLINKERKEQLKNAENELTVIKELSVDKAATEQTIEKYENYIKDMKAYIEKKKELKAKLLDQQKAKESELKALNDRIAVKQEAYDAQGFDGKKQLSYFESQKKDLVDKLARKQAAVKDLQEKIWESEIQFKQTVDKVVDTEDSFNELCRKTVESCKSVVEDLQDLKNPHIQKLFNDYILHISSWEVPSHTDQPDWMSRESMSIENISHKITNTYELLQRMEKEFYLEKLNEMRRKRSELKLLLVKESESENDLSSKEKHAIDEVKSLETQSETVSKSIVMLKNARLELETTQTIALEELEVLTEFHSKKAVEYRYFVYYHEMMIKRLLEAKKKAAAIALQYGNEIAEQIEKELV